MHASQFLGRSRYIRRIGPLNNYSRSPGTLFVRLLDVHSPWNHFSGAKRRRSASRLTLGARRRLLEDLDAPIPAGRSGFQKIRRNMRLRSSG